MGAISRLLFCVGAAAVVRTRAEDKDVELEQEVPDHVNREPLISEHMRILHGRADSNSDGKLSFEEIVAHANKMREAIATKDIKDMFKSLDHNKDKKVSLEEVLGEYELEGDEDEETRKEEEAMQEMEKLKFKAADTDGDGFLNTEQELLGLYYPETSDQVLTVAAKAALKEKDKNGDGKLNANEFWGFDVFEEEGYALPDEENKEFISLDKDKDGFLDVEELKVWESGKWHMEEAMKKMVEVADKDGDKHLTEAEFDEAREELATTDAQEHLKDWVEHEEL